ncbi:MAG: type I polyketide synthase [Solirubrobacterales bacterium]
MAGACLDSEGPAALVPALRGDRSEPEALIGALAQLHVAGATVGWERLYPGKKVPLPTYPFQRERFWLAGSDAPADAGAIGQEPAGHPLLGAEVVLPGDGGRIFTGRLSLQAHPWLADHAVAGTVLLPGTAFLELALHAGRRVGAEAVAELTLQAPLVLPEVGAVAVQVFVEAEDDGRRRISIRSRREDGAAAEAGDPDGWTENAAGALTATVATAPEPPTEWPPPGAEPLDLGDLYASFADRGFEYGPGFQGLTAAWRSAEGEVFAEVALNDDLREEGRRYVIHPALLDAALHASLLADGGGEEVRLPFEWRGVEVCEEGAASLRVHLVPDDDAIGLRLADPASFRVGTVAALATRPVDPRQIGTPAAAGTLFAVDWIELPLASPDGGAPTIATLGDLSIEGTDRYADLDALLAAVPAGGRPEIMVAAPGAPAAGDVAATARRSAAAGLELAQAFLAAEPLQGGRLVVMTSGAVATDEGGVTDPAAAGIWGLLRSAQVEHLDRIVLVDHDGDPASLAALFALPAGGEPQFALREGRALVPRLHRIRSTEPGNAPALDPERTVLLTGGTGALGAIVARHLVEAHDARHLLLASRSGPEAEGAEALRSELEALGAEVDLAACDVGDREELTALIGSIDPDHPLGAVIHAAGVLDDGVVEALDPDRIDRVMGPKADAAWHLHELTADLDLTHFVLFSSVAGTLGSPGQANYAAANAFLDALAARRRAEGLPATSIAWGLWRRGGAMAADLTQADLARIERAGIEPIDDERGLDLFDSALAAGPPVVLAVDLAAPRLRELAAAGFLPPLLAALVRVPARRPAAIGGGAAMLAALPEAEREAALLQHVLAEVAAVLGHDSPGAIEPGRAFKELGFDSLAAVELRNRLATGLDLGLQPSIVFDFPAPERLAAHLHSMLGGESGRETADPRERQIREALGSISLAQLRRAGLLDPLLRLAEPGASERGLADEVAVAAGSFEEMDLEALIAESLGDAGGSASGNGGAA